MEDWIHYRLPLKLINSGLWAAIGSPARAVLPVIGVYANQQGKAWPGMKLITELAGYGDQHITCKAIHSLVRHGLVIKEKEKRSNNYFLTNEAIWIGGSSYFPLYKDVLLDYLWAELTPCEKAVFGVLATKGGVERAKREYGEDARLHYKGDIYPKKYRDLSGVSKKGFYNGLYGLRDMNWISLEKYNEYIVYQKPLREIRGSPKTNVYRVQKQTYVESKNKRTKYST